MNAELQAALKQLFDTAKSEQRARLKCMIKRYSIKEMLRNRGK